MGGKDGKSVIIFGSIESSAIYNFTLTCLEFDVAFPYSQEVTAVLVERHVTP